MFLLGDCPDELLPMRGPAVKTGAVLAQRPARRQPSVTLPHDG
jgi:hypothetical protein